MYRRAAFALFLFACGNRSTRQLELPRPSRDVAPPTTTQTSEWSDSVIVSEVDCTKWCPESSVPLDEEGHRLAAAAERAYLLRFTKRAPAAVHAGRHGSPLVFVAD